MSDDLNYFATSLVGSITAFSLYKVISTQCRIGQKQKQLNELKNLKIKSADDAFAVGQRAIVKGNVARNTKDSRNDVIVRQQEKGKKQEYVAYVKFRQTIYSNQNFSNKEQYVINFKDLLGKADIMVNSSFLLKGLRNSITITNFDNADYSKMLDITKWQNRKRRLMFTQKLEVLMLSYLRALGTLVITDRGRPSYLRGIDVGTRQVQTGLKVGASILALGTIGVSLDGQIFLEPHLLFKDKLSIIANIQDILEGEETTRNIWLVALFAGCIYVGRRIYKYQKKHDIITDIKNWWKGENKPTKKTAQK